jgi:hypothetical protein
MKVDPSFPDLITIFLWRCEHRYDYVLPDDVDQRALAAVELLDSEHPTMDLPWVQYMKTWDQLDPHKLDLAWASFFATGDDQYLDIICDAALRPGSPSVIDLTSSTAQWSLKTNAAQHPAVLAYIHRKRAACADSTTAKLLDTFLPNAPSPGP